MKQEESPFIENNGGKREEIRSNLCGEVLRGGKEDGTEKLP